MPGYVSCLGNRPVSTFRFARSIRDHLALLNPIIGKINVKPVLQVPTRNHHHHRDTGLELPAFVFKVGPFTLLEWFLDERSVCR